MDWLFIKFLYSKLSVYKSNILKGLTFFVIVVSRKDNRIKNESLVNSGKLFCKYKFFCFEDLQSLN